MGTYVYERASDLGRLVALQDWLDPKTTERLERLGVGAGWRCLEVGDEEFCTTKTFTQQAPEHVAVRGRLTERLRALVAKAARCRSVAEVAAEHGLGWRCSPASMSARSSCVSHARPSRSRCRRLQVQRRRRGFL